MIRKAILRSLLGFPLGVFLSYTISIFISLMIDNGRFFAVEPSMAASMGSEIYAVILQYVLSGLLGMGFAAGSVVWENESWSLFKRTAIHLIISAGLMFPIAYANHWMERSVLGVVSYVLIFVVLYAIIWGVQWLSWMRKVREINAKLGGR